MIIYNEASDFCVEGTPHIKSFEVACCSFALVFVHKGDRDIAILATNLDISLGYWEIYCTCSFKRLILGGWRVLLFSQ